MKLRNQNFLLAYFLTSVYLKLKITSVLLNLLFHLINISISIFTFIISIHIKLKSTLYSINVILKNFVDY